MNTTTKRDPNLIYLAKGGEISGPYSEEQYVELAKNGEVHKYTWIWEPTVLCWTALDPAPEPLVERPVPAPQIVSSFADPVPIKLARAPRTIELSRIAAVCHDYRAMVSGILDRVTEDGCELVATQNETSPTFANDSVVHLNLFDSTSGKSMNVSGKLAGVSRKNGNWAYAIRWKDCPEIVLP